MSDDHDTQKPQTPYQDYLDEERRKEQKDLTDAERADLCRKNGKE